MDVQEGGFQATSSVQGDRPLKSISRVFHQLLSLSWYIGDEAEPNLQGLPEL